MINMILVDMEKMIMMTMVMMTKMATPSVFADDIDEGSDHKNDCYAAAGAVPDVL